jgi:hypothetical protein
VLAKDIDAKPMDNNLLRLSSAKEAAGALHFDGSAALLMFSWVSSRGAATVSAADRAHQAGSVNALLSRCGGRKEKARRDAGLLAHGRRSICGGIPPATSR